ncbi:MAG: biotin/lipoate A/B protein ligase family protein [Gemmatimonadota bacterium]|jgi:lipoate-protein ligase A
MAVDQTLFEGVQAGGQPVLRLYRWSPACLSFGRNQPARGRYDPDRARAEGIDIVRRPTGGLAVLHDRELTYAVAVPADVLGGPRETYLALNRALVRALVRLGLPAAVAPLAATRAEPLDRTGGNPCFAAAAPGEVTAGGRKLVGSAQRYERRTVLQHGSILLDSDQSAVTRLQTSPPPRPQPAPGSILQLLGRLPDPDELENAIVRGVGEEAGIRLVRGALTPEEVETVQRHVTRYRSPEWTWRR